jgi:hypothetical protein
MNKLTNGKFAKIFAARGAVRGASNVQSPCSIDVRFGRRRELVQNWTNDPDSGQLICAWSVRFRRHKAPDEHDALQRATSDVPIAA